MTDQGADLGRRIAARLRRLRAARGLTIDALARRTGVSRSMISLIERAESSPTAVLLERLAGGLDVSLASLFDAPAAGPPLVRRVDQPYWRDPGSGYRRRNVSPPGFASRVAIVEVELPAAAAVAFETGAREVRVEQQVWVLQGSIEVRVGESAHRLDAGDCLGFVLDRPTAFRNLTHKRARYAVVIASEGRIGGSP